MSGVNSIKQGIACWPQPVIALSEDHKIVGFSDSAASILGLGDGSLEAYTGGAVHELLCCHARDYDHSLEKCPLHYRKTNWFFRMPFG